MNRIALIGVVVVVMGGIAILGYDYIPDDEGMSRTEQEAAANAPSLRTENNTQRDETIRTNVATSEDDVVDLNISSGEDGEVPARTELLTVEGYDPYLVRLMLMQDDMPVGDRNAFLQRLERALGDKDKLAAVLKELRAELHSG